MVRALQPRALLDNRLEVSGEGFGSLVTDQPSDFCGDFVSPEQIIPPQGIRDAQGREVLWESCVTMNNHWGYCGPDRYFKPAGMLIRKLVECVSKGGNLLLNVGPDARGCIPPQSQQILARIGAWMEKNGDSIYGCGRADVPKPDFGYVTARGDTLYYHVIDAPIGYLPLHKVPGQQLSARLLATGEELDTRANWITGNYPDYAFVSLGPDPVLPDADDTVIAVEAKK